MYMPRTERGSCRNNEGLGRFMTFEAICSRDLQLVVAGDFNSHGKCEWCLSKMDSVVGDELKGSVEWKNG